MSSNSIIRKQDVEVILEINRKAIEIENEVAEQNEEIIETLGEMKVKLTANEAALEKITKQNEEISRDIFRFKTKVFYIVAVLGMAAQIVVEILLRK